MLRRRTIEIIGPDPGIFCCCNAYGNSTDDDHHSGAPSSCGPSTDEVMLRLFWNADKNLFESELLWFLKNISRSPKTSFGIFAHAAEFLVMSCKQWRNSSTVLNVESEGIYFSAIRYSMKWHSSSERSIRNAFWLLTFGVTFFGVPPSYFGLIT